MEHVLPVELLDPLRVEAGFHGHVTILLRRARVDGMAQVAEERTAKRTGKIKRISHWIGGASVPGESGRSGPVYNPAAGVQTGEVDFASVEEVDRAVQAAKGAFESWRAVSLSRRTDLFFRIRELVHEHREDIAKILT